jgi:hypothetical protein
MSEKEVYLGPAIRAHVSSMFTTSTVVEWSEDQAIMLKVLGSNLGQVKIEI